MTTIARYVLAAQLLALLLAFSVRAPAGAEVAGPAATPTTQAPSFAPLLVRAKIEIVWPHNGASVREADLANITVFLFPGSGEDSRTALDSPPCAWSPTVRLWASLNNSPAAEAGIGRKRIVRSGGRTYPVWDFNDVDVSATRDAANKLSFYATVDSVKTLHNVWVHAADARTLFPQQDVPEDALLARPDAVDTRIEIVWPHGGAPVQDAERANISVFIFHAGTQDAISPRTRWTPIVRLHSALNNDPEESPGRGLLGRQRQVTATNGVIFLAWDFNDVDVSAARDALNRLSYWVTVEGTTSYPTIWAHGVDARTLFPQPDVPNSCR